jgi:perosamine synthetase
MDCIDTTYVSYVGEYVSRFEDLIRQYTGAKYAELRFVKLIDAI